MTVTDPKADQYARAAEDWTDRQYANAAAWFERRAGLLVSLGPRLQPGDEVLELACGDGALGELLLARSLRYHGVDITPEMVAASNSRLGDRATAEVGDLNSYVPPAPVAATALFRALYYIPDRRAFFRHTAEFTERKLMFDFNPRQYAVADVVADLGAAGLGQVELRPFFVPLTLTLPRAALAIGRVLERSGPLARLILRFKFTYVVAAWR
jgi:hypothetical protein